jgi:hypothetical protein
MTRDPVSRHWDTTVDRCDDQLRYLGGPPKALRGVDHTSATLHRPSAPEDCLADPCADLR